MSQVAELIAKSQEESRARGVAARSSLDSQNAQPKDRVAIGIAISLFLITAGHYLAPEGHHILHNILQRLYYIPIIWAAYHYGMRGGLLVAILSGLLYLPHIIFAWQSHPVYQVTQIVEIILFPIAGVATGFLFEQKLRKQQQLQSYEKMALFGTLSRSIIRSLKRPLKSLKGMLIAMEPMAERDQGLSSFLDVMRQEVDTIEKVRIELISLVERKRLRLKRHSVTTVLFDFASQIEPNLKMQGIRVQKSVKDLKLMALLNQKAVNETLQQLVEAMVKDRNGSTDLTLYAGQSSSFSWMGATWNEVLLDSYFKSDLATTRSEDAHDYKMIAAINVMSNHFGDVRIRRDGDRLVEFILVFPRKINLPWYLKDAATSPVLPT